VDPRMDHSSGRRWASWSVVGPGDGGGGGGGRPSMTWHGGARPASQPSQPRRLPRPPPVLDVFADDTHFSGGTCAGLHVPPPWLGQRPSGGGGKRTVPGPGGAARGPQRLPARSALRWRAVGVAVPLPCSASSRFRSTMGGAVEGWRGDFEAPRARVPGLGAGKAGSSALYHRQACRR